MNLNNLDDSWHQNNHQYLKFAVSWIGLRLRSLAEKREGTDNTVDEVDFASKFDALQRARGGMMAAAAAEPPPTFVALSRRIGLTVFEQEVLLLCIAMELSSSIAALCAQAQADQRRPYPTFLLTFALFENASWEILSSESPLRYWRLIEIHQPPERPFTTSAIRANLRVLSYVQGINDLDESLRPFLFEDKRPRGPRCHPPNK